MAGQIIFYGLAAMFTTSAATVPVLAWRIGRIGDRRDFSVLGIGGAILCAALVCLFAGAIS